MSADNRIDFIEVVARKKLNPAPEWEYFAWERIGETDDLIVTGGVPRLMTRGPRKGKKTWDGARDKVVVTRAEIDAAHLAYESETGKCFKCTDGQAWCGWSAADGHRYKDCSRCNATGVAPSAALAKALPVTTKDAA